MRLTSLSTTLILSFLLLSEAALGFNLDWEGLYRIEAVKVSNSELDGADSNKSYINHHLILKPRAVVADGLSIFARFDIFNNSALGNSQFGQFFGSGIGDTTANSADNTNTLSQNQDDETLLVTQLYMTYDFEFASFVAGRAPLHFGSGLTHNAGSGLFDHWYDNRDLLAFEVLTGNLKIKPMFAKVSEGDLAVGDDIRDYMISLEYDNAETDTGFGIFFQSRRGGIAGNDAPQGTGTATDGFDTEYINVFLRRGWGVFDFNFETGFAKGSLGVADATNGLQKVKQDGTGIALDMNFRPENSLWEWNIKTGFAGGDDPNTTGTFEGFFFDRNYDVGLLLFNHVLGQFDALSSSFSRNTSLDVTPNTAVTSINASSVPDVETVSNAIYISPAFTYEWSKEWDLGMRFVYAVLNEDNVTINGVTTKVDTDLGYEIDISLTYRPHERLTWVSEFGYLIPGKAWEGGTNGFAKKSAFAAITKAAISF